MNVLSLDLGSRAGWSAFNYENGSYEPLGHGFVDLVDGDTSSKRSQSVKKLSGDPRSYDPRPVEFSNLVRSLVERFSVDLVSFEDVEFGQSLYQVQLWGSLRGAMWSSVGNSVQWRSFDVGSIKKFATGRGDAQKEHLLQCLWAHGFQVSDDNECDAIWIAIMTCEGLRSISTPTKSLFGTGPITKTSKGSLSTGVRVLPPILPGLRSAIVAEKSSKSA